MLFVETRAFTARLRQLISDEQYRLLQLHLAADPTASPVIPGTGGLRKLRWAAPGRGKRGGLRLIYFHHARSDTILLLFAFAKNERADLTSAQRDALRQVVEREYR